MRARASHLASGLRHRRDLIRSCSLNAVSLICGAMKRDHGSRFGVTNPSIRRRSMAKPMAGAKWIAVAALALAAFQANADVVTISDDQWHAFDVDELTS